MKQLGSIEAVRMVTTANIRPGKYEDEGFTYLPSVNISVQGLDANLCWQNTLRIARNLKLPVEATFEWYNNPKASNPGVIATIRWAPK